MTTFSAKQVYEAYAISFDFASVLGAETISSITVTAIDQADSSDVSLTVLDPVKQTNTDTVVYLWVRAGTSGHDYLITVKVVGSGASQYELEGILPVQDIPTGISSSGGCVVPPAIEPITLADLKMHLKLDSETLAGNISTYQSILPGSHIVANNYTTHAGAGVNVIGKQALVNLNAGTVGAGGTVDAKIQESDDNIAYTDWTGGAFTQVTAANDNAIQEKQYTGTKQYIRVAAKVLVSPCEFGADIIVNAATTYEDDLLTDIIAAARERVEDITRRALLTQTWDYTLPAWPSKNYITLPYGNLQSVPSVKWKDTDGTETTLTANTDYIVETNGDQCGRIVLPYGISWPSGTLYPSNPIVVRFVCGWASAALVPRKVRQACLMVAADLNENREAQAFTGNTATYQENKTVQALLASSRLWEEF